jgi:hypothetical protein
VSGTAQAGAAGRPHAALEFGHYSVWTSSHTSSICGEQHEEGRMFSLDKLKVYDQALASADELSRAASV